MKLENGAARLLASRRRRRGDVRTTASVRAQVLAQECIRYNKLVDVMELTLPQLDKALLVVLCYCINIGCWGTLALAEAPRRLPQAPGTQAPRPSRENNTVSSLSREKSKTHNDEIEPIHIPVRTSNESYEYVRGYVSTH